MIKDNTEEFYEKFKNFVSYTEKMKELKNLTKGHKQRFINMIIEFLKFKEKTFQIQMWISYIISFYQKEINKYKKFADEPVMKKLDQLLNEFFLKNKVNEIINNNISILSSKENINSLNIPLTIKNDENKKIKNNNGNNGSNIVKKESNDNEGNNIEKISNQVIQDKKEEKHVDKDVNNTKINSKDVKDVGEKKIEKKINQLICRINNYESVKEFITNSINKQHKNNRLFCEIYQLTNTNLTQESESTKQKLLILICFLFPFISYKQKTQLLTIEKYFEQNFINSLKDSNLLNKSKNNNFSEYLVQSLINKETNVELLSKLFQKNLFINNSGDLIELYQLYLISKIFNFSYVKNHLNNICFKIKFILNNYNGLYDRKLGCTFEFMFKTLWRLKNFYTIIYQNKIINDENENIKYIDIYFDEKVNNCGLIQKNNENNLDILFSEEENKVFDEINQKINTFYRIKNNINIISGYSKEYRNYKFPFNLVELINYKNELIINNFQKYKSNLIKIEKTIYRLGYESFFPYNSMELLSYNNNIINKYAINPNLKEIIKSFDNFIHIKLNNYDFKLYPYGSVTEFLSDKESDIDLFLDISTIETKEKKIHFLYQLIHLIKQYIDKKVSSTISTRVCVITFIFCSVSFDISIVGFCPYLHSSLIREYSLIDPRFPLLVISIKYIIKILKINNISDNKTHAFLNSFSWVLLLIGFLQDIVSPPVLPKILENSEIFEKKAYFGNNKIEKEDAEKSDDKCNENKYEKIAKSKNFESFINNIKIDRIKIPKKLGDVNFRINNYKNQITQKNNMSCSELLLKFLEFIIFYFKHDTIFVNCSFTYEGFQNMEKINDDVNEDNNIFINYFNNKYNKKNKGEKSKDGYFLIRDPFDPRYNPAQTLKASSLKKLFSRLKMAYYHLLKYGELNMLKKQVEYEEMNIKNK